MIKFKTAVSLMVIRILIVDVFKGAMSRIQTIQTTICVLNSHSGKTYLKKEVGGFCFDFLVYI